MSTMVLGVRYDGAPFCGWQIQPDVPNVQATLEAALHAFVGTPVKTVCAGRTDTGVHATCQVVSFDSPVVRHEANWVRGLNTLLPRSVSVRWAKALDTPFHARFDARARVYEYWLYTDPVRNPFYEGRLGWVFRPLDVDTMREAAQVLLGEHDFSSFRASQCQAASPVRTIYQIDMVREDTRLGIRFIANAFLHHMVRNIVGSLVYVGMGRWTPAHMAKVLDAKCRDCAAPTFSPAGLYFTGVYYPGVSLPSLSLGPFGEVFPLWVPPRCDEPACG